MQPADGDLDELDVARARRGDLSAFNTLVECHQRMLYSVALRMVGDAEAAADVVQEGILAAWQHLGDFRSGSFRAWLTRIVVNRCYDVLRSRQRRPERSIEAMLELQPEGWAVAGQEADPLLAAVTIELGRHLVSGLGRLPPDQRAVLILCDVQGFTYAEAAAVEGANVGTIKSRLSRARAKLRDWLAARPELLPMAVRSSYGGKEG